MMYPVWDPVTRGLAALLDKGAFLPGERLPDPEELAVQLVLNPAAIRRAYEDLERQGVLEWRENAAYLADERREEP